MTLTESRVRGKRKNKPAHNYGYNISTIAGSEILKRTLGGEPHSSLQNPFSDFLILPIGKV